MMSGIKKEKITPATKNIIAPRYLWLSEFTKPRHIL